MKRYMLITTQTLSKIGQCFSDPQEIETFLLQLEELSSEIVFTTAMRQRVSDEDVAALILKETAMFTIFCRNHIELIQELVKNLDCQEISEDEMKQMRDK